MSGDLIHVRYWSTHLVSSNKDAVLVVVVVVVVVVVFAAWVNAAANVGIRRPDALIAAAEVPVVITPGRAVTPCATDTRPNVKIKLNVCFKNDGIPNFTVHS